MGMLWLNDLHAWIACKYGEVHDKIFNNKHFKIKGMKVLFKVPLPSATQIKRCFRQKQKQNKNFAIDICKILDEFGPSCKESIVFEGFTANYRKKNLYELRGTPPQREVDHAIDLVLGVATIAKAPYRQSFKENVKLDTQLLDFLKQ